MQVIPSSLNPILTIISNILQPGVQVREVVRKLTRKRGLELRYQGSSETTIKLIYRWWQSRASFYLLVLLLLISPVSMAQNTLFDQAVQAYQDGQIGEAARIWHELANAGDVKSQYNLGLLYEEGRGLPLRPDLAAYWYRSAARQGYNDALFNLGGLYFEGNGVPKIIQEAVNLWTLAADQGMTDAQYNLGSILAKGTKVPRDLDKARAWLQSAADLGHQQAAILLGSLPRSQLRAELRAPLDQAPLPVTRYQNLLQKSADTAGGSTRTNRIFRENWIKAQQEKMYTVVISNFPAPISAEIFSKSSRLDGPYAILRSKKDETMVCNGVFPTRKDAYERMKQFRHSNLLPKDTKVKTRNFGWVQGEMDGTVQHNTSFLPASRKPK